jgi:hypothetical protein
MEKLNARIDDFKGHVASLIEAIEKIENYSFQKVLYLVMIDGLSTSRFPEGRKPRERFQNFVSEYGKWPDGLRVSLPQADLLLSQTTDANPAVLRAVRERLSQWADGEIHNLKSDPFPEELPEDEVVLECQHIRLLWVFRNCLVHEFRHPGYGFDIKKSGEPFYYLVTDRRDEGWELVYPSGFLKHLSTECLLGTVAWFTEQHVNPFKVGYQGRHWLPHLRRVSGLRE